LTLCFYTNNYGIQLSLLFVVYSDEKHFFIGLVGHCSHCFMALVLTQIVKL